MMTMDNNKQQSGNVPHSELPWTLGQNGDKCARNHAICSGPSVIAKVYGKGYPIGEGWSPQSEADARLIVTAVNSFDALVGALERVISDTESHGTVLTDTIKYVQVVLAAIR